MLYKIEKWVRFACELLLKALLYYEKKENKLKQEHKLLNLYKLLDNKTQQDLDTKYQKTIQVIIETEEIEFQHMSTIVDCFTAYDNSFIDFRYIYEGDKQSNTVAGKDLKILLEVLQSQIQSLEIKWSFLSSKRFL